VYIRSDGLNRSVDLANWNFASKQRGKGHATRILEFLECEMDAHRLGGIGTLRIGQVINPKFRAFLERRPRWVNETPANETSPTFAVHCAP
jgi:hypothetical protein